jgi:hypothetical protein
MITGIAAHGKPIQEAFSTRRISQADKRPVHGALGRTPLGALHPAIASAKIEPARLVGARLRFLDPSAAVFLQPSLLKIYHSDDEV